MTQTATPKQASVTTKALLSFFLPLAASSMMMMGSHSIISSALARTANAAAALAAYSVAQSVSSIVESPCHNIKRMAIALLDDKASYNAIRGASLIIFLIVLSTVLLIAYGPLGPVIFLRLLGIPSSLYQETIQTFRIFLVFPAIAVLRSFYQALIIKQKKTYVITINMMIRLLLMVIVAQVVPRIPGIPGGGVGAILLAVGVGSEAILSMITAFTWKSNLAAESTTRGTPLRPSTALLFYLPLAAASILESFSKPLINSGLARTASPELALAGYQVAYSFAWIFVGIAFNIHQVVIVFANDAAASAKVRRFVWTVGLITTCGLLLLTFTGGTSWIIENIIGVDASIRQTAVNNVIVLSFMPLTFCLSELYSGMLIVGRQTSSVTVAKLMNTAGIAVATFSIASFLPQLAPYLAGLATLFGSIVEGIVAYWRTKATLPPGLLKPKRGTQA